MFDSNPYYNPEKCGLELVYSYDRDNESYQFNIVVLWRDLETSVMYVGEDSGCSCPIPFEDFHSLSDMDVADSHTIQLIMDERY